jgi:hypothetical protein
LECLFLYILGTVGYTTTLILLIKYLNSSAELLLKYFTADLLVSSVSFLMALSMDISFNLAIYNDRFGHVRPKMLKQAPGGGGWTLDGARNSRHFTFLGDIEMMHSTSSTAGDDESSALSYCGRRMMHQLCYLCRWKGGTPTSTPYGPRSGGGLDTSTPSPLLPAEEALTYSDNTDNRSSKKVRGSRGGLNTHWIDDYSSDESPSPVLRSGTSMESPESQGGSNRPILL